MKGLFYALLLHLCLSPCLPLHWFQRGSVGIPDLRQCGSGPFGDRKVRKFTGEKEFSKTIIYVR
jgi:hypothetical protein